VRGLNVEGALFVPHAGTRFNRRVHVAAEETSSRLLLRVCWNLGHCEQVVAEGASFHPRELI